MAKITYIGGSSDMPAEISMYGQNFVLNIPIPVEDVLTIRKLTGHPHFKVEALDPAEKHANQPPLAPLAPVAPAQLADPAIQTLHARAVAVGLRIDRRWSSARLAEEVIKAETASAGAS